MKEWRIHRLALSYTVATSYRNWAELARTSVFQKPIACGWGRTHNIVELRDNIGVIIYSGGDAFEYRTAGSLQKMYKGITKEEANLFADFTVNFYK